MSNSKTTHNTIEKIIFWVGIVVLLGLFGYLAYQISQPTGDQAPQIEVSTMYRSDMDDYTFEVEVENPGGESAEEVQLKMKLYQDGETAESANVSFKYVPVKSKRTAFIVFNSKKKASDSLVVASKTYNRP